LVGGFFSLVWPLLVLPPFRLEDMAAGGVDRVPEDPAEVIEVEFGTDEVDDLLGDWMGE